MARQEIDAYDIIFINKPNGTAIHGTAIHMGVLPEVEERIERACKKNRDKHGITTRTSDGETRTVIFTDALVVLARGPAYETPKRVIIS